MFFCASAQSQRPVTLRVNVELVTTEVRAFDKKGDPVRNLKRENFHLYEDGKEQEISSFDEVTDDESNSPGKTVLILFDGNTLTSDQIKPARDSAIQFVKKQMESRDFFAIVTLGMSLQILQNFTNDREKVLLALGQPALTLLTVNRTMGEESPIGWQRPPSRSPSTMGDPLRYPKELDIYLGDGVPSPSSVRGIINWLESTFEPIKGRKYIFAYTKDGRYSIPGAVFYPIDPRPGFEVELDKFAKQLGHYYLLGFQPGDPRKNGTPHKIEVKTDLKGVTLGHQSTYIDRRPTDTLADSKQEQSLLDVLAFPATTAQLPLSFRPSYFYVSPRMARVMVSAKIGTEKIELKKKSGQLLCDLNVMGIAYAEDGSTAARFSEILHRKVDEDKEKDFRRLGLNYQNFFKLRPGKYRLKLAVSDRGGEVGSVERSLDLPAAPDSGLVGSSLVLVEATSPMPQLLQNIQARLLDNSDPFIYAGMRILPSIENRLPAHSPFAVLFKLYNFAGGSGNWKIMATPRLRGDNGPELSLPPVSLDGNVSSTGDTEATVAITLPFQNATPGKYKLSIEINDTASSQSAIVQSDLELVLD
jgi:hypothetical protein